MSPDAVQVIARRAGGLAGFGFRMHPHQLRHACDFALAEDGTDTRLIQDCLGTRISRTQLFIRKPVKGD